MRLAVSNLAWGAEADEEAYDLFASLNVKGIEIAPTRMWPEWAGITEASIEAIGSQLTDRGLTVAALQSILFGLDSLRLFGTEDDRHRLRDHLQRVADLAGRLGARSVVFGSPKNRRLGSLTTDEAYAIAAGFFADVAPSFADVGSCLCLEPNPPEYGCDFITTFDEAVQLAEIVDRPGFGVHIDTGAAILTEASDASMIAALRHARHIHISEPFLASFEHPSEEHARIADLLATFDTDAWRSIEMRNQSGGGLDHISEAIAFTQSVYARIDR